MLVQPTTMWNCGFIWGINITMIIWLIHLYIFGWTKFTFDVALIRVEEWWKSVTVGPNTGHKSIMFESTEMVPNLENVWWLKATACWMCKRCLCCCVHNISGILLLLEWCRTLPHPHLLAQTLKHLKVLKYLVGGVAMILHTIALILTPHIPFIFIGYCTSDLYTYSYTQSQQHTCVCVCLFIHDYMLFVVAFMHSFIHSYIHTYMHACIYMHLHLHSYIQSYIHGFIHMHVRAHTHMYTYTKTPYTHIYIYKTHSSIRTSITTCKQLNTYMQTNTRKYICRSFWDTDCWT